ncbi:MAG: polysaccharide biosynthesis tyrosine autokinase [Planctomycetaceae bacterium]|nr:polysaccharide biosynthesis tyrosine autokinase [Planctomycetaceae bacterium]
MNPLPHPENEAEFDFAPFGLLNGSGGSTFGGRSINITQFVVSIWKPLAVGGMLGILLGMAAYLVIGPVYSASTQVLVSRPPSVPDRDGPANSFGDRGDHIKLMKTDEIILRAFKDHGLSEVPELAESYDPLKSVSEDLNVSRSSGQESSFDNILDIGYSHPDKKIAKRVVQAIVESYRDYLVETRNENSHEVYTLLLSQQHDFENRVAAMEKDYHQFRRDAPVFLKASPVITLNGMPAQAQSQAEMEVAELERAQRENTRRRSGIEARLTTLQGMLEDGKQREVIEFWVMHSLSTGTATSGAGGGGGGTAALAGPPAKAQLDQQLMTARLLEQRLLHTLGADHTSVRNVRQQIDTILDFYRRQGLTPPATSAFSGSSDAPNRQSRGMDMVGVYQQMLEEQLRELDADDEKLVLLHKDAQARAKDAEMFEIEDQRRKDEIARIKDQADQNFKQIAAYDLAQEEEGYRMKQISQVRIERSMKQVIKIVGAFTMLGVAAAFCFFYFREWNDTRLKTLDEVRELAKHQLLGSIPKFTSSPDADRLATTGPLHPALCYYHRPGSKEAEAFRGVRTSLFFGLRDGDKVVQISSPEPGDGKSTVAANMAAAIAQSGKKVLLIDCDLRRPTQHGLFRVPQENGLTDVLLGEATWRNTVRSTAIDGLSLITAGLCPDNPAELLSRPALSHILESARESYDLIILDSPPILVVSDPCIISPSTNGLMLVFRMMKTKQLTVQRTNEVLQSHGIRTLGVIVNDLDEAQAQEAGLSYDAYSSYYNTGNQRRTSEPLAPAAVPPLNAN